MRFTADHHFNLSHSGKVDGLTRAQPSLPIEWKLTFSESKGDRAMISYSVDLCIGRFEEGWRFVTFSAKPE